MHKRCYSQFKLSQTAVTCSVQCPTCSIRLLLSFEFAHFKFLMSLAGVLTLPCYIAFVLSNECIAADAVRVCVCVCVCVLSGEQSLTGTRCSRSSLVFLFSSQVGGRVLF